MDDEFNEDIVDLVTQISLAEHYPLEWDAGRLDAMREIIVCYGAQVQDHYRLCVEGVAFTPSARVGSIHSMSSHSSRDSSYFMFTSSEYPEPYPDKQYPDKLYPDKSAARVVSDLMGRSKDSILQLRTKLQWYQKSIVREISMSGSGSSHLDHVSATKR